MGIPTDVSYAPDGRLIAVSSSIGVYRYITKTFEELPLIETGAYVRSVAFSPDSRLIAAGEENGGSAPVERADRRSCPHTGGAHRQGRLPGVLA